jgi:tetratricopeptide (TPR) repeat protein
MPPVDPLSGFNGIRLSPDAVIARFKPNAGFLSLLFGNGRSGPPSKPSDILSLAGAYREKKDFNAAKDLLRTLVKSGGESGEHYKQALFLLALCCHSQENYDEAARWYGRYLEQSPGDSYWKALARGNLADACCALGCFEEAEPLFRESLDGLKVMFSQAYPNCPYYHMLRNYGTLLSKMNRKEEAAQVESEADSEEDLFWFIWVRCT